MYSFLKRVLYKKNVCHPYAITRPFVLLTLYLKEYEAEHGPTPNDDSELLENGVGGKSGNSSGSGTPRGQNSGSVSPTHESNISGSTGGITAVSKSLDSSGPGNKMDTTAS